MHRVIQHDALAAGMLNSSYTGGTAQHATWKDELSNNDELLTRISKRMESDYESLNPKMRKPIALRDLETLMHPDKEQYSVVNHDVIQFLLTNFEPCKCPAQSPVRNFCSALVPCTLPAKLSSRSRCRQLFSKPRSIE